MFDVNWKFTSGAISDQRYQHHLELLRNAHFPLGDPEVRSVENPAVDNSADR